jgi:hypothetical protein
LKEKESKFCITIRKGVINMNKKLLALASIIIGGGILFASSSKTLAYRGDPNVKGPNYSEERHEAMIKAFENKDYKAWKELMQGRGRVSQVINEGNFAKFAEMHKLMLEGKTDKANAIRAELGLGLQNGSGQRMGYGRNANR